MRDPLGRQDGMVVTMELGRRHEGRDGARAFGQLGAREHGDHAGQAPGLHGVDAEDPRMSVRAPDHGHPQHAGEDEVVGVASGAAQQAIVLLAPDGSADERPAGVQRSAQTRLGFRCASRCLASSGST
jgi:hypothetical protein